MQEKDATTATTEVPKQGGNFPPFDTASFPSQLFWLAVTFAVLFTVLWKVSGPRIRDAIALRRGAINGAIAAANKAREEADAAAAAYDQALVSARRKAQALAEETRQKINAEVAGEKARAEAQAATVLAEADARIAATRATARTHVAGTAREAAIAIVARLTGETVTAEEADKAIGG